MRRLFALLALAMLAGVPARAEVQGPQSPHGPRPGQVATAAVPGLGSIAYDPAGNITSIGASTSVARSFVYDDFGRLTNATRTGSTQDYTYDRYGNMITMTTTPSGGTAQVTRMGVHSDSNRVDQTVDPSGITANMVATYDAAGNVISTPTASFVYDPLNTVRESTTDVRRLYIYNASDERVASVEYLNGKESWTLRDLENRVLRRFTRSSGTWTWAEDYVYGAGRLIAAEVPGPAKVLHFHLDHLSSPRLITGNGGAQVGQHDYYPFGGEVPGGTNDGERFKFTGHERDLPGTLNYMHARYYDGMMGRFLSVDRIGGIAQLPASWNRYTYAHNGPLTQVDPDGNCSVPAGLRPGNVGICIESFIAAKWIGGAGRGDHRTFAGNDPRLSNRIQAQMIVNPTTGLISLTRSAGVSSVLIEGFGRRGTNNASVSNVTKTASLISFTVSAAGTNGLALLPLAPDNAIMWNLNLDVSRTSGGVGIAGASKISGFPSTAMYAYKMRSDGTVVIDEVFTHNEQTSAWLGQLNWPIEPVPPAFIDRTADGGADLNCFDGACR